MILKKVVKQWGEGLGIYLTKDDVKINELKVGDVVEVKPSKQVDTYRKTKDRKGVRK